MALNPIFHERTKHFEKYLHFVREKISNGVLKIVKVNSFDQNADILTKSLGLKQRGFFDNKKMGLVDVFNKKENK